MSKRGRYRVEPTMKKNNVQKRPVPRGTDPEKTNVQEKAGTEWNRPWTGYWSHRSAPDTDQLKFDGTGAPNSYLNKNVIFMVQNQRRIEI